MKISNQQLLIEIPCIAKTNNKKLVIKRYQFDGYEYINLSEHRQFKGNWYPSKTKHLTFAISYLNDFLKTIQQVRTTSHQEYEAAFHIVHNNSKDFHQTRLIDGKEHIIKQPWSKEYKISISKKDDVMYISKWEFIDGVYRRRFSFELPNKRQIIKRLLNL